MIFCQIGDLTSALKICNSEIEMGKSKPGERNKIGNGPGITIPISQDSGGPNQEFISEKVANGMIVRGIMECFERKYITMLEFYIKPASA